MTTPRLLSLLIASLLPCLPGTAWAENLTLSPGATTWDGTTANWLNPVGSPVTYFNSTSTQPIIYGPVSVNVAVPRTARSMTLNNGVILGGDYLLIQSNLRTPQCVRVNI